MTSCPTREVLIMVNNNTNNTNNIDNSKTRRIVNCVEVVPSKDGKWTLQHASVKKRIKNKNHIFHFDYIWRPFDCDSAYLFDRYGIAIEICEGDEYCDPGTKRHRRRYRCCICLKNCSKGMFAAGSQFDTVEEAYADFARLVEISGKAFWLKPLMKDRYYTSPMKDKAAMVEATRNARF